MKTLVKCPCCDGEGTIQTIWYSWHQPEGYKSEECPDCGGAGEIEAEEDDEE